MDANLFEDTIAKWGKDAQIDMAIEEMSECILALQHFRRGRINMNQVASEIADVEIMMAQLRFIFRHEFVDAARNFKLQRLHERVYNGAEAGMPDKVCPAVREAVDKAIG